MPIKTILKNAKQLVYQPQLFSELIKSMDESSLVELKSHLISAAKDSAKSKGVQKKRYAELVAQTMNHPDMTSDIRNEILDLLQVFEKRKFRSIEKSEALLLLLGTRKLKRNVFSVAYFDHDGRLLEKINLKETAGDRKKKSEQESIYSDLGFSMKLVKIENNSNNRHALLLAHPKANINQFDKIKHDLFRILE